MALIQSATGHADVASGTISCTFTNPITAGNTVLCFVVTQGGIMRVSTVSDTVNNFTLLEQLNDSGATLDLSMWHTGDAIGGKTTITATLDTAARGNIICLEYDAAFASLDAHGIAAVAAGGAPFTFSTPTISDGNANDYVIGCCATSGSTVITDGVESANPVQVSSGGTTLQLATEDQSVAAIGNHHSTFTSSASVNFVAGTVSIKQRSVADHDPDYLLVLNVT